jgi:hypothetical protein
MESLEDCQGITVLRKPGVVREDPCKDIWMMIYCRAFGSQDTIAKSK